MIPSSHDIQDLSVYRANQFTEARDRFDRLANIYNGKHQELYPEEFRTGEVEKVAGFVRRTWRMFSRKVGKVPDVHVASLKLRGPEKDRADLLEKICFHYNDVWAMKRKMNVAAFYLTGFGASPMGLFPDMKNKGPALLAEDPRNVLPGAGWDASNTNYLGWTGSRTHITDEHGDMGGQLEDCIVQKVMTGRQLIDLFGQDAPEILDLIPNTTRGLNTPYEILMYYDDTHVVTVMADEDIVLSAAEHGAPWCPWFYPTVFAPDRSLGASDFEQQIGLEIAFMRLLDQKLSLNDSVVWPLMFQHGQVDYDPDNRFAEAVTPDAQIEMISPPANFQVDRDMSLVRDLLRLFNFETEASQGEISGSNVTGRGIVELSQPTVDAIQSFFDDFAHYLPSIYTTALLMDRELFGNVTKEISGQGRGETFVEEYTPNDSIGDRFGKISVEFGPGLGGYEGQVQLLQQLGAEAIPLTTVMEKNPNIRSVTEAKRQVFLEKVDRLITEQAFTGEAAVPIEWLVDLRRNVSEGEDPFEWIADNPPTEGQPQEIPPERGTPGQKQLQPAPLEALLGVS